MAKLRFFLGWAQEVAATMPPPRKVGDNARSELEPLLKEQPENYYLIEISGSSIWALGDKAAAFGSRGTGHGANPIEKDRSTGLWSLEILARVAAQMGEPDRAIAAYRNYFRYVRRLIEYNHAAHSRAAPAGSHGSIGSG